MAKCKICGKAVVTAHVFHRECWQRRDCTRRSAMMRESGALNRGSFRANTQLFHPFYNIRFRPHFYVQKPNMPE